MILTPNFDNPFGEFARDIRIMYQDDSFLDPTSSTVTVVSFSKSFASANPYWVANASISCTVSLGNSLEALT